MPSDFVILLIKIIDHYVMGARAMWKGWIYDLIGAREGHTDVPRLCMNLEKA